ncbi:MAG: AI-2E family transporter [Cyanobacteria bacterium WB6_1B_304]|jgi:predicted PurR-regulated permease PerM|nr:AI-2E family transporter [Cyanobacteria bacterium WB6_1B_304]
MIESGLSKPKNKLVMWWDSLTVMSRILAIALVAPLAVLNAWAFANIFAYFRSLLVVVLFASLLSFLLNYPVSWLEKRGLGRTVAAILVFLLALVLLLVAGVTLVPLALSQAQQLVARLPEWFDSAQRQLLGLDQYFESLGWPVNLDGLILQINNRLKEQLQFIAGRILNLTLDVAVFTAAKVLDVLLTVISMFYLLQHGYEVWDSLVGWLPDQVQQPFSRTVSRSFQNYFIGQIIVSSCVAFGLVSIFLVLKIPFGLLFGLIVGLMALVPFGCSAGIILVTFLTALRDIGGAAQVLAVSVVVQQIVENGIAPKVLGSVTGLNPFWVFIAILTGARVGGLLGVIIAIPMAVVIKEALETVRSVRKSGIEELEDSTDGSSLLHFLSTDVMESSSETGAISPTLQSESPVT